MDLGYIDILRQIFSITNLCKRCFNLFSEKFENKPIVNKIIFVSNPKSNNISKINLNKNTHEFFFAGNSPMSLNYSYSTKLLYVTNWYENKILGSVILIAIIQFIQVPHMVWNADIMLEAGIVSRVHPVIDWFLYGVDLIEIVSIVNVGMIMFSLLKKRQAQKRLAVKTVN